MNERRYVYYLMKYWLDTGLVTDEGKLILSSLSYDGLGVNVDPKKVSTVTGEELEHCIRIFGEL